MGPFECVSIFFIIVFICDIINIIRNHRLKKKCTIEVELLSVLDDIKEVNEMGTIRCYGDVYWEYYYLGKKYRIRLYIKNGVPVERFVEEVKNIKINPEKPEEYILKNERHIYLSFVMIYIAISVLIFQMAVIYMGTGDFKLVVESVIDYLKECLHF